jgi:tetratricopeptide (TPR) repeat protein
MLYFYNCQQFDAEFQQEDQATIQTVSRKIEHLKSRRELVPNRTLKIYDRSGLYVQRFMGQGMNMRVLIQEFKFDYNGEEHIIYFFREYIPQSKYEPRWRNYILPEIEDGIYKDRHPLLKEEIKQAKQAYIKRLDHGQERQSPPWDLVSWFQEEGFGIEPEFRIYETQNWVTFSAEYGGQYLGDFFLILDAVYHETAHHGIKQEVVEEVDGHRNLKVSQYQEVYLIHEAFLLEKAGSIEQFMLIHDGGILSHEFSGEERLKKIKEAVDFSPLQAVHEEQYGEDSFAKGAVRAYPANLLGDRATWRAIQMYSNKSNLALSPEQLKLLKHYDFPKFINGQAGSGKSEMLYYLIAEVIFRQQVYSFEDKIIFLTENEELLKKALQDTRTKLVYNSQYKDVDLEDVDLQRYFSPFRRFLLDKFVDDPAQFPEDKFVNFARFRKLYKESNLPDHVKKRYSAEIGWYVIYTFIKGQNAEIEALDEEGFNGLYRRDKGRLDKHTFRGVYEKVWMPFYAHLRQKGYWDQLDLVRDILNRYQSIPASEKLTVILCDEAQDFTRIELQLIIRLSRFSDFDLSGLDQVPISFAGDPFQTVNPTGFSLEKLKRLFGKELEEELSFKLSHDRLISELSFNYRSSSPIVDFANVIQYFRRQFLNTPDLNCPQEAKRLGKSPLPQLFDLEGDAQKLFSRLGKGVVYLVSCNDGEERSLVEQDTFLEEEMIVKSSARAKGSEYPTVAIYKFGQHFVDTYGDELLENLLRGQVHYEALDASKQFEISFFFNKLYVAITRAQEGCYVIDTVEGIASFWQPLRQIRSLAENIDELWVPAIKTVFIEEGNVEMVNNTDLESLLKIAQEEKENGLAFEDPDRLRDAAKAFGQVPDIQYEKEVDYCKAKALEFEHQFEAAGDILIRYYRNFGYEALIAYLLGEKWGKILEREESNDKKLNTIRFIAKVMQGGAGVEPIETLDYITKAEEVFNSRNCRGRISWKDRFFNNLSVLLDNWASQEDSDVVKQLAERMSTVKWASDDYYGSIASLYASVGKYAEAVEYWELCEQYNHPSYYKAKLRTPIDIGERLFYSYQLEDYQEIIDAYQKNQDHKWQKGDLRVVVDALLKTNAYEKTVLLGAKDADVWVYIQEKAIKYKGDFGQAQSLLSAVLSLVDTRQIPRHSMITPSFLSGIGAYILAPFVRKDSELYKPKRIADRMKAVDGALELVALFIMLLARSKAVPRDFSDAPSAYALVGTVVAKRSMSVFNSISEVDLVCAVERTYDKLLSAIKAIRKMEGRGLREQTFIKHRIQKLRLKKVMIDVGGQSTAAFQKLNEQQQETVRKLYKVEMESFPIKESGQSKLLTFDKVIHLPLFPDFDDYSEDEKPDRSPPPTKEIGGKVEEQSEPNGVEGEQEVKPEKELDGPIPIGKGEQNKHGQSKQVEKKPTGVTGQETGPLEPEPIDTESPDFVSDHKEVRQLTANHEALEKDVVGLGNKVHELEQQINRLEQALGGLEDLKIVNSKLQVENTELYRELAEVQGKYIELRDKE